MLPIGKYLIGVIIIFDLMKIFIRSGITRIALMPTWKMKPSVKFLGPVYRRSYGGSVSVGIHTTFGPWVNIDCASGGKLAIGDNVSLNFGVTVVCRSSIQIGNDVRIGELASIRDNDHNFNAVGTPISKQGYTNASVTIGQRVWIGRGAVIMPGVTIGQDAIIGANSVVTKSIPPNSIAVGAPAKVIRQRAEH